MKRLNPQSGQTLIETIVALFILTMALVGGLGLAIYATTHSTMSRDEIIATNLAREGVEVIRMMRDTNWLSAQDESNTDDLYKANGGCSYSGNTADNRWCYPEAFSSPYALASSNNANDYRVMYTPTTATGYTLDTRNGGTESYLLCLQPDGSYRHNDSNVNCDSRVSGAANVGRFARRVSITTGRTSYPYTNDVNNPSWSNGHSPEKVVTSVVIWEGRGCAEFPASPSSMDPVSFSTKCKVTMSERLTNWKDYE